MKNTNFDQLQSLVVLLVSNSEKVALIFLAAAVLATGIALAIFAFKGWKR